MKLNKILISMIGIFSISASAATINEQTSLGVYGNIKYDFSDYDYLNEEDRLNDTSIGFYVEHDFHENADVFLDIGLSHSEDFVTAAKNDFKEDQFSADLNKAFIRYYYDNNSYVDVGRMFTPVGLYNEDPLNKNNLFDSSNDTIRYTDAVKFSYLNHAEDINFKIDIFGGVRLDNSSNSSNYGFNANFGNSDYGHFNIGYVAINVDGVYYIIGQEEILKADKGFDINLAYLYESDGLNMVVSYNKTDFETFGEENSLFSKVSYKIKSLEPYISYETKEKISGEEDVLSLEEEDSNIVSLGLKIALNKNIDLYAEASNKEYKDESDYTFYYAGLNFRF